MPAFHPHSAPRSTPHSAFPNLPVRLEDRDDLGCDEDFVSLSVRYLFDESGVY
jgi:hypothetical protein